MSWIGPAMSWIGLAQASCLGVDPGCLEERMAGALSGQRGAQDDFQPFVDLWQFCQFCKR